MFRLGFFNTNVWYKADFMKNSMTMNVIDWFSLSERMDNDEAYISETIENWFSDYSAIIEVLKAAVHTRNADDIFIFAHKIRGSSAIFGMDLLSEAAGLLEDAGHQKNFEKIDELMQTVSDEFNRARDFVSQPNWIEKAKQQSESREKSYL